MVCGQVVEAAHPEGRVLLVGEHGHRLRCERQPLVVVDLDDLGRALVVGPLPHPPLVEPQPLGQLGRCSAARRRPPAPGRGPSRSPRWTIAEVTAPSSFENTRYENSPTCIGSRSASAAMAADVPSRICGARHRMRCATPQNVGGLRGPGGEVVEAGVVGEHLGDRLDHADALLEPLDVQLLVPERQGDGQALGAGPGRAARAVQVGLVVSGGS